MTLFSQSGTGPRTLQSKKMKVAHARDFHPRRGMQCYRRSIVRLQTNVRELTRHTLRKLLQNIRISPARGLLFVQDIITNRSAVIFGAAPARDYVSGRYDDLPCGDT